MWRDTIADVTDSHPPAADSADCGIEFARTATKSYSVIEESVFLAVESYLEDRVAIAKERVGARVVGVRGANGDVLLSHSVRDRNYYGRSRRADLDLERFRSIFVPGQWLRERILKDHPGLSREPTRVVAVGHPRIDALRLLAAQREAGPDGGRRKVLWAPAQIREEFDGKPYDVSTNSSFAALAADLDQRFEVDVSIHPRDRKKAADSRLDLSPVTEQLIASDVVITDCSSVIFEAWALGKPVVFPRWLIGDAVVERFPGSAEAYVHENRIGLHAESFDELVDMLQGASGVADDVDEFMHEYLANYRRGSASQAIAEELVRMVDPAVEEHHARREALLTDVVARALQCSVDVPERITPRASIQLLQDLLLTGDFGVFERSLQALRRTEPSRRLLGELAILETDALILRGKDTVALQRASNLPDTECGYFEALVAYRSGREEDALLGLSRSFSEDCRSLAPLRLLADVLESIGEGDRAWAIAHRIAAVDPTSGALSHMAPYVHDRSQWRVVERHIPARLTAEGGLDPLSCLELLDAAVRSLPHSRAVPAARELALSACRAAGAVVLSGWPASARIPAMYLPLENLPAGEYAFRTEASVSQREIALPSTGAGTDEPPAAIEAFRDIVAARAHGDAQRVSAIARSLRALGEPDFDIQVAGMARNYLMEDLPARLGEARFLLHLGDGVDSAFHIDLWLDYVKAVDPSAILAIRSRRLFEHLSQTRPGIDAVYVKTGIEAEWLVNRCENLRAVLYVSNTGNTIHFLRFNHLRHVWLGHGDSEKAASCHKFFRAYDEVWTAGRAQIDRFMNSEMNHDSLRFRIVGRPELRDLVGETGERDFEDFLYLPTWEGFQGEQEYTSIRDSATFLPLVSELVGRRGRVKFHPWVGKRDRSLSAVEEELRALPPMETGGVTVIDRDIAAVECMRSAKFLIADISSVISDFLPTGRPIFVYEPRNGDIRTTQSAMGPDTYCYVFHDAQELVELVQRVVVDGDDWLKGSRVKAQTYFVDPVRTRDGAFEEALRALLREEEAGPSPWSPRHPVTPAAEPHVRPLVVGHRGGSREFVENSLQGFRAVAQMERLDAVELDVHVSRDGALVVIHDPTLDRMTDGEGPVGSFDRDQLAALRLRNTIAEDGSFLREGVPMLEDVLDIFASTSHQLQIELKTDALGNSYAGLEEKVLDTLEERGMLGRSMLTSFSPRVLATVRNLDSAVPLLASVNLRSVEMLGGVEKCLQTFAGIPGCTITLDRKMLTALEALVPEAVDLRRVGAWVVNSRNDLEMAWRRGVRQITTDVPAFALEVFRELSTGG